MEGKLFSQDFLQDGILSTPSWESQSDSALESLTNEIKHIYAPYTAASSENEQNTISEIIEKILILLGWQELTLREQTSNKTGRQDVPDFLLFPSAEAKQQALSEKKTR